MFFGVLPYGHERNGILSGALNSHPLALKHLIPALTHFYIGGILEPLCIHFDSETVFQTEVEQTGASSQFYDKFSKYFLIFMTIPLTYDRLARCKASPVFTAVMMS